MGSISSVLRSSVQAGITKFFKVLDEEGLPGEDPLHILVWRSVAGRLYGNSAFIRNTFPIRPISSTWELAHLPFTPLSIHGWKKAAEDYPVVFENAVRRAYERGNDFPLTTILQSLDWRVKSLEWQEERFYSQHVLTDDLCDAMRLGMSDEDWDSYMVPRLNYQFKEHNTIMHITRADLVFLLNRLDLTRYPSKEILEDYGRFPISIKYIVYINNVRITDRQWRIPGKIVHYEHAWVEIWLEKTLNGEIYPFHLERYRTIP